MEAGTPQLRVEVKQALQRLPSESVEQRSVFCHASRCSENVQQAAGHSSWIMQRDAQEHHRRWLPQSRFCDQYSNVNLCCIMHSDWSRLAYPNAVVTVNSMPVAHSEWKFPSGQTEHSCPEGTGSTSPASQFRMPSAGTHG